MALETQQDRLGDRVVRRLRLRHAGSMDRVRALAAEIDAAHLERRLLDGATQAPLDLDGAYAVQRQLTAAQLADRLLPDRRIVRHGIDVQVIQREPADPCLRAVAGRAIRTDRRLSLFR